MTLRALQILHYYIIIITIIIIISTSSKGVLDGFQSQLMNDSSLGIHLSPSHMSLSHRRKNVQVKMKTLKHEKHDKI